MVLSPILARGIFASYFVLILSLFAIILGSLRRRISSIGHVPLSTYAFGALMVGSFYYTWYYMIKFLQWSFYDFESQQSNVEKSLLGRVTQWLMGTDLFEQAWRRVCEGPLNWWWSEQLCILTVGVWTTFLFAQGSRRRVPFVWAYMLLGQLVAISVASNLFFAALVVHDNSPSGQKSKSKSPALIPARVYIPILLSHLTILLSPTVAQPDSNWFFPNLLTMHLLIVLPLLNLRLPTTTQGTITLRTFYLVLATLALIPRAQTYLSLPYQDVSSLARELWAALYSHPAQSSIGLDVVWTTASFAVYCAVAGGLGLGLLGLVSPGLALYLDSDHH
ncbi:putative alpha-1,2-mannosyltransferase [Rhizoctonia solani 123E]|uniref:Putative alpha-1,2-mannosyltransferase n=1 Tax=Rhizoctonia solani 123E TaxID=1423351 RepID=A0A074SH07_9AGAM|nr:putative alpha-1,2-mannosyltransferase [Rhizoctonia solani 123E]